MSDTTLLFSSLAEQGAALRAKRVSSVELTTAYLGRLEPLGPRLGALAHVTRDLALVQAAQADQERAAGRVRGPLHGIPFGVKDLLATAGSRPSGAARPTSGRSSTTTRRWSTRLRDAGAVLIGKLSMVELAGGGGYRYAAASVTGPGRTPWNPEHWSGGSSSGRARRRRRGWWASASARRRGGASCARRRSAASRRCARRSGGSAGTGRWRCPGRWTSSGRWRARRRTAA